MKEKFNFLPNPKLNPKSKNKPQFIIELLKKSFKNLKSLFFIPEIKIKEAKEEYEKLLNLHKKLLEEFNHNLKILIEIKSAIKKIVEEIKIRTEDFKKNNYIKQVAQ